MAAPCSEFEQYFPDTTKYNECIAAQRLDSVVRNLAAYTSPTEEQVQAATEAYFPTESPMYTMAPTTQQTLEVVKVYQQSLQTPQAGQGGQGGIPGWVLITAGLAGLGTIIYFTMKGEE